MDNPSDLPEVPATALKQAVKRKLNFFQTLRAVLWSFFGVRHSKDHAQDIANLNPVHIIIAGLLAAALFVFILILIVRMVLASA